MSDSNSNIPQTPEAVAYQLMNDLFAIKKTSITQVTSEELMVTFAQCLELVRNPEKFLPQKEKNYQKYSSDRPKFFS
jgi:hypothetical protein